MQYKAHINEQTGEIQSVAQHCRNTAELCSDFSIQPLQDIVTAIGLLHDIGKYQLSFQRRIDKVDNRAVEHSTCGAIAADENYPKPLSTLMEYCIAGHHSGLPDGGAPNDLSSLQERMKRTFEDYNIYKEELSLPDLDIQHFRDFLQQDCCRDAKKLIDKFAFLTRYCFSCLVDADSIDTARFCSGEESNCLNADFAACLDAINTMLDSF